MELTGKEYKRLTKALTKAFPTVEKLDRLLKFQLDKSLAEIVEEGSLSSMVYEVIGVAQAEGWLGSLINGAKKENPDSPFLKGLKEQPSEKVTSRVFAIPYLKYAGIFLGVVILVGVGAILKGKTINIINAFKNNNNSINIGDGATGVNVHIGDGLDGEEVAEVVEASVNERDKATIASLYKEIGKLELTVEQERELRREAEELVKRLKGSDDKTNLEILQLIAEGKLDEAVALKEKQVEERIAQHEAEQEEIVQDLIDLALLETFTQPQKSLEHLQKAVGLDGENLGALAQLGALQSRLGKPYKAIESFEKIRDLAEEQGYIEGQGAAFGNLGVVYSNLGQYQQAIAYYEQALEITLEAGDRQVESVLLGNLGVVYGNLSRDQKAIVYYEQALDIALEVGDREGEGILLGNLGNAYNDLDQLSTSNRSP